MPQAQASEQTRTERVFDENGQTVETHEVVAEDPDGGGEALADPAQGDPAAEAAAAETGAKYRIGEREFATAEEALAFAQSEISTRETEAQVADAYRQGIRDAVAQTAPTVSGVTPPVPEAPPLNTEELYTNPQEFLKKYGAQITEQTLQTVQQQQAMRAQSDQIWSEFATRHPALADFRTEVEAFVGANTPDVRAIIQTKGRPASYDFIATKLKSRFAAYSKAVQPSRTLPNTGGGASPTPRAGSVTPPKAPEKPLSFAEQLQSIRKRR